MKLQDILLLNRERYHDILNAEVAVNVKGHMREIEAAQITTERDLDTCILSTGLPHRMDASPGEAVPALPFTAPFSTGLPAVRPFAPAVHVVLAITMIHI